MERLKTFEGLKHGDKIISPIDNEVTEFYIDKEGKKYLAGKTSLFPYYQFDAEDFYIYTGDKEVGEIDKEFFQLTDQEVKTQVETLVEKNMFLSGQDNGTDDYIKERIGGSMNKELQALLDKVNKERMVDLRLNTNCDGCEDGEFEITELYLAKKYEFSEDFFIVYHGKSKEEAMVKIMNWVSHAEKIYQRNKKIPQMIDIKCMIPYDEENNYMLRVKEQDKELATELVNKAYNEFLKNDHCDFQEDASKLLRAKGVEFEFSIWEKE